MRDMNPDGFAHRERTNAHGVDLNRNSPEHWAGAGARPWSEPETRAIRDLILRELPVLSIYYHQPFGLVDVPEGGRPQPARRYAELIGLPLHRLSRRPGSISRWQNGSVQPGSAFVVELAPGRCRPICACATSPRCSRSDYSAARAGAAGTRSTRRTRAGRYQFQSPMIFITAGTSTARTSVASSRIAAESPRPNSCSPTKLPKVKPEKAAIMMIAQAVMMRPVCSRP